MLIYMLHFSHADHCAMSHQHRICNETIVIYSLLKYTTQNLLGITIADAQKVEGNGGEEDQNSDGVCIKRLH